MMLELDVDGIRTATALAQGFGLKILITTGFPDFVTEAEGAADLACAIVRKPYTDEELLAAVARCVRPGTSDVTASAPAVPRYPRRVTGKA
jgi:hypothetical protein